jgi:hypothetical protein
MNTNTQSGFTTIGVIALVIGKIVAAGSGYYIS